MCSIFTYMLTIRYTTDILQYICTITVYIHTYVFMSTCKHRDSISTLLRELFQQNIPLVNVNSTLKKAMLIHL